MDDWDLASQIPSRAPDRTPIDYSPAGEPIAPAASLVGRTIGRWELRELLGQGGMGAVYRAFDRDVQREVALKLLRSSGPVAPDRMEREGVATAAARHPGIVQVHDQGTLEGSAFIVYELIPGALTLRQAAKGADLRTCVGWIRDAARALGHAHALGIVHRDVKPENLLVDKAGRVRVTDFGLAALEGARRLTASDAMIGTPRYMAPEQVLGDREAFGPPTDVWALGVVLHELVAGEHPFPQVDMVGLMGAVTLAPLPRLTGVDAQLAGVCARAMEREAGRRHPHGEALAQDLEAWLEGRAPAPRPRRPALPLLLGMASATLGAAILLGWPREPFPPPPSPPKGEPVATPSPTATTQAPPPARARAPRRHLLLSLGTDRPGAARALFVSPGRLLGWSADGWVGAWDPRDGRVLDPPAPRLTGPIESVALTVLGPVLAADPLLRLEDAPFGWSPKDPADRVTASADGERVVAWCWSGTTAAVHQVRTGRLVREVELPLLLRTVALSPRGELLALGGGGGLDLVEHDQPPFLEVHEVASGRVLLRTDLPAGVRSLAFSGAGTLAIGTNGGNLFVWSPGSPGLRSLVCTEPTPASREYGLPGTVAHHGVTRGLAFDGEGWLWSLGWGALPGDLNQLRVWTPGDFQQAVPVATWEARLGEQLALSPDGALLAVGTTHGRIEVWTTGR